MPFWPFAAMGLFAGIAAWRFHARSLRWSPIAVAPAVPVEIPGMAGPEPMSSPPPPQAEGADLAERARFVVMRFAFPEPGASRPAPTAWPLDISCQPTRFTLIPGHAALRYSLKICNRGAEELGPLMIRADLVAESRTAAEFQAEFAGEALPLRHYLDSLPAADEIELTGELRLVLADVATMRLGSAELLVPLLRLCAESAEQAPTVLSVSAGFTIGLPPLSAGGGIRPFRLDSGPGIWRKLTARRLNFVH